MKTRMALLLSVAAGVFALIAMALYLGARESELLEQAALQDIVVTTQDILANTALDERVVGTVQIPKKYVQPGAIAQISEVVGRVAAVPLPKGSQVSGTALFEGGREALAFNVPRGMRALSMAVDDVTGVAGLLRPGNFVDIVGIFEYGVPSGAVGTEITYSNERTEAITVAQNVQIIAAGGSLGEQPAAPPGPDGEPEPAPSGPPEISNVTLLLSPQQVQEIVLAQHLGALTLALRSSLDSAIVEIPRLEEGQFLKIPIPVKRKPRPSWREMRGGR
ncbi:MAG: Flp pilus assembly protein CpaB [Acidobacteriota bacterium]